MEFHTSSGCYLVRTTGNDLYELLILYRKWNNGREAYVIPKGHVEGEETLEEAATREVFEETGYKNLHFLTYLGSRTYTPENMPEIEKTDNYFLAELPDDTKDIGESHFELIWKELDEAFTMLTWENQPETLAKIKAYLAANGLKSPTP